MRFDPGHWLRWWALHLRWWVGDVRTLAQRSFKEFFEDHCPQLAASISYYVLFSIFPMAILVVSISGLILTNDSLRQDVIDELFEALPLSEDEGREDVEDAVNGVAGATSAVGLLSILGLLWSASGMMGALRHALNEAWDVDFRRPFLRGKVVDIFMVFGVGLLLAASIGATIVLQIVRRVSDDFSDSLGPLGEGTMGIVEVGAVLVPLSLTFVTFMVVFKIVPDVRTRFRYIWPGALLAAVLFEVLKNGFAIYLSNFGNYDAVYGSLGAVIAFLFFVYLGANVLLLGAEVAAEWPRVIHGHYDAELAAAGGGPRAPLRRRVLLALTGLARHEEQMPEHVPQPELGTERSRRRSEWVQEQLQTPADAGDEAPVPPPASAGPEAE